MKIIDKINQELLKEKTRKSARYEYGENIPDSSKKALEELDINHDTSWFEEIYKRNKNNLDFAALLYRGNKITYKEMFEKAYEYAKSLKQMGYDENSIIPVCMSNVPEFVYLFLGINMIGAKINTIGSWFDENYLINILNSTKSDNIFITDDEYYNLKNRIEK